MFILSYDREQCETYHPMRTNAGETSPAVRVVLRLWGIVDVLIKPRVPNDLSFHTERVKSRSSSLNTSSATLT